MVVLKERMLQLHQQKAAAQTGETSPCSIAKSPPPTTKSTG